MIKKLYTFDDFISSKYSNQLHYLVVGHPISHSLSPIMHNFALQYYDIDADYIAVDLEPQSLSDFKAWMQRDTFLGCNITIPYKQQLLSIPDQLSNESETLGAINTIAKSKTGNKITGHNTDIIGFQLPLLEFKNTIDFNKAIVFGTGGASLAVQYALLDMGFKEIILVSRTPGLAKYLKTPQQIIVVDYNQWQEYTPNCSLIVNTTPLGMGVNKDKSIVSKSDAQFIENKICFDLIYNPLKTRFLEIADEAGATTINGLDMLIQQGSRSFNIWTGQSFPVDLVRKELLAYL